MSNRFTYPNNRPHLTIELTGGASLGRCYSASYWRVTSRFRRTREALVGLEKLGMIGGGQEFTIKSRCDGHEPPAGFDEIVCVELDEAGNALPGPAINPYSGEPYGPVKQEFYVYECESRVDSSD